MDNNSDDTNSVGYGKPPKDTQFKKGKSGNPKGRPKGKSNMSTVILRALETKVPINENGRRRFVTKLEVAILQLMNKAATGDLRAVSLVTSLAQLAEEHVERTDSQRSVLDDADQSVLQGLMRRLASSEEGGEDAPADPEPKTN
jgi:Family of unknown function (DUF5681)